MVRPIEVRVLTRVYWIVVMVIVTAASSIFANFHSSWSLVLMGLVPLLILGARFERIMFDGTVLARRGPLAFFESLISGHRQELPLDHIEMIATEAIRSRRGLHQVKYFYKITIAGDNIQINIMLTSSRKRGCHELGKHLLNSLEENKLDPRSSELKQYLNDERPKETLIEFAGKIEVDETGIEVYQNLPTTLLRQVANSLKLEGCM